MIDDLIAYMLYAGKLSPNLGFGNAAVQEAGDDRRAEVIMSTGGRKMRRNAMSRTSLMEVWRAVKHAEKHRMDMAEIDFRFPAGGASCVVLAEVDPEEEGYEAMPEHPGEPPQPPPGVVGVNAFSALQSLTQPLATAVPPNPVQVGGLTRVVLSAEIAQFEQVPPLGSPKRTRDSDDDAGKDTQRLEEAELEEDADYDVNEGYDEAEEVELEGEEDGAELQPDEHAIDLDEL